MQINFFCTLHRNVMSNKESVSTVEYDISENLFKPLN